MIEICKQNKYILVRDYYDDSLIGINCGVIKLDWLKMRKRQRGENETTRFCSFIPCDINEYISHKVPFTS